MQEKTLSMIHGVSFIKAACLAVTFCPFFVDSRAARKTRFVVDSQCHPLPAPAHGTIVCGEGFPFYSCTAHCDAGYQFPSGNSSVKLECDQMFGEWFDPPGRNIPNCVLDNKCHPLPAPAHGRIACGAGFPFYSCTAHCDAGYQFLSGNSSVKLECDQMFGEWFDPPGRNIPNCVLNSKCHPLPAPAHGRIACGAGFPFYSCTASCYAGYQFPSGKTSDKRECDQMFGEYFDPPGKNIPDCVRKWLLSY
ncbi:uncharacterized protein LOC123532989 [Mercenaria mercenaria]|uniref:uncharacterized protein LOC123532989 n=1 Tax=Mercenaria mercenaria TaxID=6596 RepID=UPI00234EDCA7|nr:uncharacterized protein LOC123532989 [Mercenaria mercenaria]